jgi:hypothetical protein
MGVLPLFTELPRASIPGNLASRSEGDASSHSRFALVRWLYPRRVRGRGTPELPIEDDQPDRHGAPHAHFDQAIDHATPDLKNAFGRVRHDDHENAATGVVGKSHVYQNVTAIVATSRPRG